MFPELRTGARHKPLPAFVPSFGQRVNLVGRTPKPVVDWFAYRTPDGDALGNDRFGCCVEAADYREVELRCAVTAGGGFKPTADMVLSRYAQVTGFDPATGANDNGTLTADDTAILCAEGIRIGDQTVDIPHLVTLDPANFDHLKFAIDDFGGVPMTLALPLALQTGDWNVPPGTSPGWVPGSWGLHRVFSAAYRDDTFFVRTWGMDLAIHPDTLKLILVAAEVRISRLWLGAVGTTPAGLDWDQLTADSAKLAA